MNYAKQCKFYDVTVRGRRCEVTDHPDGRRTYFAWHEGSERLREVPEREAQLRAEIDAVVATSWPQPSKCSDGGNCGAGGYCDDCPAGMQTQPGQRGLSDDQIAELWRKWVGTTRPNFSFARAVERAHGIGARASDGETPSATGEQA